GGAVDPDGVVGAAGQCGASLPVLLPRRHRLAVLGGAGAVAVPGPAAGAAAPVVPGDLAGRRGVLPAGAAVGPRRRPADVRPLDHAPPLLRLLRHPGPLPRPPHRPPDTTAAGAHLPGGVGEPGVPPLGPPRQPPVAVVRLA